MEETIASKKLGALEKLDHRDAAAGGAITARDLFLPLAVLVLAIVPFTTSFLLFYPDERFYLDASITMHQSGDWLIPRNDDGSPRLIKPLLTYWIMVASYKLFGVHLWSARLPFLLAAAGTLVGAYWLAQLITGKRGVARLTVWIVLANPLFWLSAMRCLPDVLLAFFGLLAVIGYFAFFRRESWLTRRTHLSSESADEAFRSLRGGGEGSCSSALLQHRQFPDEPETCGQRTSPPPFCERRLNWLLGLGLGLAVGVKGAPALLLAGCLGLHALLWRRQFPWRRCYTLILPLLVGAVIGLGCFLPIFWNHAATTVHEMWRDQIGGRMIGRTWGFVYRVPLLLLTLAGLHLICIYPVARTLLEEGFGTVVASFSLRRRRLKPATTLVLEQPQTGWHARIWTSFLGLTWLVWLLATGATENCTVRYLFPLFPWLAVSLAALIDRCDPAALRAYSQRLLIFALIAVALLGTVAIVLASQMPGRIWNVVLLGAVTAALVGLWARASRWQTWQRLAACCALGPVALLVIFLGAGPLLLPDLGVQARRTWKSLPRTERRVAVLGSACQASRVRLALAPSGVEVHRAESAPPGAALLLQDADCARLPQTEYDFYPAARLLEKASLSGLTNAARRARLASFRQSQATLYSWAIPKRTALFLATRD